MGRRGVAAALAFVAALLGVLWLGEPEPPAPRTPRGGPRVLAPWEWTDESIEACT